VPKLELEVKKAVYSASLKKGSKGTCQLELEVYSIQALTGKSIGTLSSRKTTSSCYTMNTETKYQQVMSTLRSLCSPSDYYLLRGRHLQTLIWKLICASETWNVQHSTSEIFNIADGCFVGFIAFIQHLKKPESSFGVSVG
jgi:hypothetical protein